MEKDGITYVYHKDLENDFHQYKVDGYYYNHTVLLEEDIFMTVKGYKNGNVHFAFNKNFIKKFNLEVSRLRGWVKSPQEAADEFDISVEEATKQWNSNFTLLPSAMSNLLPNYKDEVEIPFEKSKKEEVLKLQMEAASNGGNLLDLIEVA
jgi:hypothetical protein